MTLEQQDEFDPRANVVNAAQAKRWSRAAQTGDNSKLLRTVNGRIKTEAEKGEDGARVEIESGTPDRVVKAVLTLLEQAGYKAKEERYSDVREPRDASHYLWITW